jgi:hypothetical protein
MLRGAASVARTRGEARQAGDWRSQELQRRTASDRRGNGDTAWHGASKDVRVARRRFGVKLTGCGAATTLKSEWKCSGAGRRVRCWLVVGGRS